MIHSIANTVTKEFNELITKLIKINYIICILYECIFGFIMYEELGLEYIPSLLTFICIICVSVYLISRFKWSDRSLIVMFSLLTIILVLTAIFLPEIKFEGLLYINLAVLIAMLSTNKRKKLFFIFITIILAFLFLAIEFNTSELTGIQGFTKLSFICLVYMLIDFAFKLYIAIRSNNFLLDQLSKSNSIYDQYYSLFKNSFNPILLVDYNQKKILDVNDSGSKLFGYSKEELKEKSTDELLLGDFETNKELIEELQSSSTQFDSDYRGKKINSETIYKHKDGSIKYCQSHVVPVHGKPGLAYLINYDRTDELKFKRQLKKSNQDYRNIFDNNLLGVNSLDGECAIIKTNHSFCEMLGISELHLVGKSLLEFVDRNSLDQIIELLDLLKNGEIQSFIQEVDFNREDGHLLQTLLSVKGVYEHGNLIQSICTVQDISQRKESQDKYRKIFDNSLSGLAIIREGIIQEANEAFSKIVKIPLNELIGFNTYELIHPDDIQYLNEEVDSIYSKKDNLKQLIFRIIVEETIKTVSISIAADSKLNGTNREGSIISCIDLTDFMEMQDQLNERQAIYEAVIDNSFTGIDICEFSLDEKNSPIINVIVRNKLMSTYLNDDSSKPFMSLADLLEITPNKLSNGEDPDELYIRKVSELMETKKMNFEWSFVLDDEIHDFDIYTRLVNVNGKMMIIRNLLETSERKRKDQIILNQLYENNKKKDELEKYIESNLQLENFAYIASHDLKAPLRTVSSFAFLLKKLEYEGLSSKGKKYLDIIISSSSNMQVLIHDLLQFARINSQKVNLKKFEFEPFLKHCIDDIHQDIDDYNGKVQFFNLPLSIIGDEIKLTQLFQNLIRNGLKFSREGVPPLVTIDCHHKINKWMFTVTDNGIGVHDEDKDKIFGIFSKLHSNDDFEGTGLGLTICQKIVEQHNGSIWLDSIVGQGTTFSFTIPKEFYDHPEPKNLKPKILEISNN